MTARCLVALLALFALDAARAQEEWGVGTGCEELKRIEIPAADRPDEAATQALAACDAEALYYGFGHEPDYARARQCAYLERDSAEGRDLMFGGAAILMMVYANGQGVAPNSDLARRFACEVEGAPAEIEGRLQHLREFKPAPQAPFDLCDDITSGYMMGMCSDLGERLKQVERATAVKKILDGWPSAYREAYARLRAQADMFFDARSDAEVDQSGTARGAMVIGERATLEDDLLEDLRAFESGQLPAGDADAFAKADAALNASYTRARKAATADAEGFSQFGTVTPDGIRDTERAWIKYRDAWVSFGAARYPQVPADAWREHFTKKRTAMLDELAGDTQE